MYAAVWFFSFKHVAINECKAEADNIHTGSWYLYTNKYSQDFVDWIYQRNLLTYSNKDTMSI